VETSYKCLKSSRTSYFLFEARKSETSQSWYSSQKNQRQILELHPNITPNTYTYLRNAPMTDTEARELLPLYALNALEQGEAAQVEAFIARNPEARTELQGFLETTAVLARSVPQLEPAGELRSKVLEKIRVTPQVAPPASKLIPSPASSSPAIPMPAPPAPSRAPSRWLIPLLSALAVAASMIAVVLGTRVSSLNTELEAARTQNDSQLSSLQNELNTIRTQNASSVAVVAAPGAKMYALFDPSSKKAVGQVVLTKDGRVFFAHELGTIPTGKTWQAWAITKDSKAVSLGVFAGSSITQTTPINIAAFGVSEEPVGGSSQPTQVRGLASL
jgi:anti-sigma-K factor RskA